MLEGIESAQINSISRHISKSRRAVTILFTDIVNSTELWDEGGDIAGRLMVDRHNRMVFPIIRKFRGRIVKTIGDAIMTSFSRPENAVKAAIGIQQILSRTRISDPGFLVKVRIGIHTGMAIVEHNDVFGDVVNVASRVEGQGKANEILVSGDAVTALQLNDFTFFQQGEFVPRGKKEAVELYRCEWKTSPSQLKNIRLKSFLPIGNRQKIELLAHFVATVFILYFLYVRYLRYVISDTESLALLTLNPQIILTTHPMVISMLFFIVLGTVFSQIHIATLSQVVLRLMKAGFGFTVMYLLVYLPLSLASTYFPDVLQKKLYTSNNLFVEVTEDNVPVYDKPVDSSQVIIMVNNKNLLLLTDVKKKNGVVWNKVLIGRSQHGWIQRIRPPAVGVTEARVTYTDKFFFYSFDLYALIAACAGFVWGFVSFRIRPA